MRPLGLSVVVGLFALLFGANPAIAQPQCVALDYPGSPDNQIQCFAVAADNTIASVIKRDDAPGWTAWGTTPGEVRGDLKCYGWAARLGSTPRPDRRSSTCFINSPERNLRTVFLAPPNTSGVLASPVAGFASDGGASCVSVLGDPVVGCAVRGRDNALLLHWSGRGGLPVEVFNRGGVLTADPVCIKSAADRPMQCFVRNTANGISAISCTERGCTPWVNADGVLASALSCVGNFRPPTARAAEADIANCFTRGTDDTLYRIVFDGTRVIRGWSQVAPRTFLGAPSCVAYPGLRGELLCAVRATSGLLSYSRYDGTRWSAWFLGATETISGDPSCFYRASTDLVHCAARNSDGRMAFFTIPRTGAATREVIGDLRLRP